MRNAERKSHPGPRERLRVARGDDQGGAIVLVLVISVLLLSFASMVVQRTATESRQALSASEFQSVLHAAEAGVNDYIAKVTEDHLYYGHEVHPAEDRRTRLSGGTVAAGTAWPGDPTWSYATGDRYQTWRPVGSTTSLYEYNLIVVPPGNGSLAIAVTATGRKRTNPKVTRSLEVQFQGTSVADFQMLSNASVSYGSAATTNGKIYSNASVTHDGTANQPVYAASQITGSGTFNSQRCDSDGTPGGCLFSSVFSTPISFASFSSAGTQVYRAAQSVSGKGIILDTTASIFAYQLTFNSGGTVTIETCTSGAATDTTAPTCTGAVTKDVPTIGAIYSTKSVIVKGTLKGRVTVASGGDIIVGAATSYVNGQQDVLGLIAEDNIYIAQWVPNTITWYGAVIARTGQYKLANCSGAKAGTYKHVGAVATAGGGCMSGFTTRIYEYDTNLQFLQPPFFPVLEEAYKILRYREVN